MVDKQMFSTCHEHPDCTLQLDFVDIADPTHDVGRDAVAVPARLLALASRDLPGTFCISVEHLSGTLRIEGA